ncbi:MAG: prohead protease/major capsid protein fusion protein [Ottowia sp.]|uniref:prohead protease/major capsid protein fusion protein n=1 Tax=Ottowia sp. TaxID=1898956 RepID=UPI003C71BF79
MPQAHPPEQNQRRGDLPIAGRAMELRGFTRAATDAAEAPLATADIVFTTGAAVRRYDYWRERAFNEVLVVEEGAIRLERLQRGAPLLNSHSSWDLEDQIGVVDAPAISGGQGTCRSTFSRRESVAGFVQDVEDGIIRNVSVGYVRHRVEMVPPEQDGGIWTYRVIDWEPYEVSLVPIPADMDSQVQRSAGPDMPDTAHQLRTFPCEFIELSASVPPTVGNSAATSTQEGTRSMPQATQAAGGAPAADTTTQAPQDEAQRAAAQAAASAADITELCARHGVADLAANLIRAGNSVDEARAAVLDRLAVRDAAAGGHRNVRVETVADEAETRSAGIQEAILHRISPRVELTDNGRQYRGLSLVEIGREMLEAAGHSTRGLSRLEIATRMLHVRTGTGFMGTSDFSALLANVAGRRLRAAYEQAGSTYRLWARQAPNAPDFKDITVVQLSGAPELLRTNEHGEFKYGTLGDSAEKYSVITYGRIVSLTRQAIVNDDLRGFDRLVQAFGNSASRLENRLVYAQITGNPKLSDNVDLFHANHGNLGTTGTVLNGIEKLGAGRLAMRKQKGIQGEQLNVAPRFLIVPAALEQVAYQYTSSQYVPAEPGKVNEFRAGGRTALEPIVEPLLDDASATAWYLAADSAAIDTVEFCYLDGAEGPVIESEMGFEVDGVSLKARLDFAAKAVEYRGLYKATGAA